MQRVDTAARQANVHGPSCGGRAGDRACDRADVAGARRRSVDALTWVWRDALGLPAIAPKTPFVLLHLAGFALGAGGALLLDLFAAWRLRDAAG